jgi:hypothetical protein
MKADLKIRNIDIDLNPDTQINGNLLERVEEFDGLEPLLSKIGNTKSNF